jgi:hypothetical protein
MLTEERTQYTYIRHRLFLTAMAIHLSLRVAPPDLQQEVTSCHSKLLTLPRQFHCLIGSSLIPFFDKWSRVTAQVVA